MKGGQVVSPALVGRDGELARLVAAVAAAPAVVVVEGEAGVGKTRLVEELLASPQLSGWMRLVGRCRQIREPFPLGAVVEAVRGLGEELTGLALGPVAGALRPLIPELARWLPVALDPLDDRQAERHRVFRGLVELLTALATAQPVVVVLEDLHWADAQTREFIAYWLSGPVPRVALVLTHRSEDADAEVSALTARLPRPVSHEHVMLTPLDAADTGALTAAILGVERVSAEFASYLWERTGGLPLAVEEVLALVRARGLLVQQEGGWTRKALEELDVPRGIRDPTLQRVARLPAAARRMAEAAALLGVPSELAVLVATAGPLEGSGSATDAVELAIGSGLLAEQGELIGFRHVLAAEALYESLSGPRRHELHGRAAGALRRTSPPPLGRIAYHLKHAGDLVAWVDAAEAAADQAIAVGDEDEGTRLLEDVLRHAPLDLDQRGRIAVKLGRAANDTLHAYDTAGLLAEVVEQNPPAAVRGELRLLLANALNQYGGDLQRQRVLFAQAVSELDERRDLQAWALVALGLPIYPDVPVSENLAWLNHALALADDIGDPLLGVFVAGKAAAVLVQAGDPAWRGLADRIRRSTGDAPRLRRETNAHYSLGVEACHAGHLRSAELLLTTGLQATATRENRRLELMLRSALALLAFYGGRWDGLGEETGSLLDPQADLARSRIDVELVAGCLALARGEVDEALQRLTGLIGSAERVGSSQLLPPAADAVARALLSRGDVEAAVAAVRRCLAPLAAKGLWAPIGRLLPSATESFVAAGDRTQAAELTDRAARELRDRDAPLAPAALHYAHGILSGSAGDLHAAAELYEAALAPYEAARASERAAGLLFETGQAAAAEVQLKRALSAYERLGASWDHARAARLARQHGMALTRRHGGGRRSYGTALSPQELAVAELAARGHTNKQIAAKLFISHRTVDKHMRSVMRKMGTRSRTELGYRLASADHADASKDGEISP